jgi:type II restriction/modification system DNA methylase subunit YeeA
MEAIIDGIKSNFRTEISDNDPKVKRLQKLNTEYYQKYQAGQLFDAKLNKAQKKDKEKFEQEITKLDTEIKEIKSNKVYEDAFEWRFEFPEVLDNDGVFIGFDIVIGNPPYIQLQKLSDGIKSALLIQKFDTFAKTGDIYQLFYEHGVNLLRTSGFLSFITSNKWMRTDYGSATRKFLSEKSAPLQVIDFGMAQIFDSATTYTNIIVLTKASPTTHIVMCRVKDDYNSTILLEDYLDFAAVEIENPREKSWIAYEKKEYELIKKIVSLGTPLKDWGIQINRGLLTGFNEAFIIDTETRNKLISEDPRSEKIIFPILRGEDVKAYIPEWTNKWIINSHNGVKHSNIPRIDVENDYPAIYNWLAKFEPQLKKRLDQGDHWTNLRNCAYLEEFYKPKIIYPNMTKYLPFVYDKHQFFINDKAFILSGENLEYLTIFLNSKIFKFAFKDYFPELLGESREIRKVFFETVSVMPTISNDWYREILTSMLFAMENNLSVKELEKQIDDRLFDYYELTNEERSLVLNSVSPDTTGVELKRASSSVERA